MEERGNRRLLILDILIIAGIAGLSVYALMIYTSDNKITYNFQQQVTSEEGQRLFLIAYNFTAETFSAQTPIEVSVIGKIPEEIVKNNPKGAEKIKEILVYFPTATTEITEYSDIGYLQSFPLVLEKGADGKFRGSTTITYPHEGDKCMIPTPEVLSESENCPLGNIPAIHISSADSKFQLENNRTILFLTLIFLAFTLIMMRDFLHGAGHNISLLRKKRKDEPTKPKPK